ncbi:MAG: nucleotide exchange factor GrpE [Planctomycetaceae bacterium]|nr:nucleotide exchange factor GrpE [Planctomycetaceae bacterium]
MSETTPSPTGEPDPDAPDDERTVAGDASDGEVPNEPISATADGDSEPPPSDSTDAADVSAGQLQDANERVLRAQAELENFRKRLRREMEEQRRFAAFPLLSDLLPVVDNLDRAVQSAKESLDPDSLLAGVEMVAAQLIAALEKHACQKITAAGEPFDPNLHEAIGQQPSEDSPEGCVAHVALNGYCLHDRVIRPSQVLVSTGTPDSPVGRSDDSLPGQEP